MIAIENPPGFVVRTEAQKAAFDNVPVPKSRRCGSGDRVGRRPGRNGTIVATDYFPRGVCDLS